MLKLLLWVITQQQEGNLLRDSKAFVAFWNFNLTTAVEIVMKKKSIDMKMKMNNLFEHNSHIEIWSFTLSFIYYFVLMSWIKLFYFNTSKNLESKNFRLNKKWKDKSKDG